MAKQTAQATSWNLTPLLKSDTDPEILIKRKTIDEKTNAFVKKWKERNDYLTDPLMLKQALDDFEELEHFYAGHGDEWYYFNLRTSQDQINADLKAKDAKAQEFSDKIANEKRFFLLKVAKIDKENHTVFLESIHLTRYKHFLERLFAEAQYLLSEPEEKIIDLKSMPAYANWVRMTETFLSKEEREIIDMDGKKKQKNFSELASLLHNTNKKVRDSSAAAFNDILDKYKEVAENEINSILANKKVDDELRNITRPDLSRHISDDIDTGVVDSLLKAVSDRNDIPNTFYALKAKLLGQKQLAYHERGVPYGTVEKKYKYEESLELVGSVFQELDPEFSSILTRFTQGGQIDVFPSKGKRSGAFCAYNLLSQPTYVLLNHTDRLQDVLTLAHEMGHAINDELMRKKQHALNFGTPTSTAEVASTFMEDFVLQRLLKEEKDDELRLTLMMNKLDDDVSSIFRQVACYQFEQSIHKAFREKGYLSYKDIGDLFQKNMKGYMGTAVEQSPGSQNWWVYWIHVRYFFYVYSYASGLLISKSLQNGVKQDHRFIEKVKTFLSAGIESSPKHIFANMNVDITDKTFWEKGLDEVEALLEETTQLAKKLKKI